MNSKPDFLTPTLNCECLTAPDVKGQLQQRRAHLQVGGSVSVGVGLREDLAALGLPQVSAAVGIAGGQTDNSVLNSPSQLAQGS